MVLWDADNLIVFVSLMKHAMEKVIQIAKGR
jgi:hypothetical protein